MRRAWRTTEFDVKDYNEKLGTLFNRCREDRQGLAVHIHYMDPDFYADCNDPDRTPGKYWSPCFFQVDVTDLPDWSWPLLARVHPLKTSIFVDAREEGWAKSTPWDRRLLMGQPEPGPANLSVRKCGY